MFNKTSYDIRHIYFVLGMEDDRDREGDGASPVKQAALFA